jgi:hypothetical protein
MAGAFGLVCQATMKTGPVATVKSGPPLRRDWDGCLALHRAVATAAARCGWWEASKVWNRRCTRMGHGTPGRHGSSGSVGLGDVPDMTLVSSPMLLDRLTGDAVLLDAAEFDAEAAVQAAMVTIRRAPPIGQRRGAAENPRSPGAGAGWRLFGAGESATMSLMAVSFQFLRYAVSAGETHGRSVRTDGGASRRRPRSVGA